MPDKVNYDESRAFRHYIKDYYGHLMTVDEKRICWAWLIWTLAENAGIPPAQKHPRAAEPFLQQAMRNGPEVALQRVAEAVLSRAKPGEILINRCPNCARIVATPKARQCLWCGHDWH